MKKLTILGVVFLSMTILFSCGEDAKSDKESEKDKKKDKYKKEIKDPCDILDYSVKIFEDLNDLADNYDDIDDLEDDKKDKKKVDDYFDDLEEAWKYAFKEFDNEEILTEVFGSCDNEEIEEESYEVEDFFEERFEDFERFIEKYVKKINNDMEEESYDYEGETEEGYYEAEATEEEYYYEEEYETEEVPSEEVLSNRNETENLNSDNTPFYIINTSATKNENQAKIKVENLISNGYKAGYLWIPDYKSLSGAEYYSVYIGHFYSQYECEKFVDFYRGINPESYGLLVSHENKRVKITGIGKVKVTDPYHNQ